jgi:dedicator of cytokinesis protein 3
MHAAMEEPQVFIGIFPASHIHIRDELADAEGRLQEIFNRLNAGLDPYSLRERDGPMETLREEDETGVAEVPESLTRKSIKLGPRPEQGNALRAPVPVTQPLRPASSMRSTSPIQKLPPPRPSLKSGDDTAAGAAQPLIDEISSALREWHNLLFTYLSRRDYKLFQTVRNHIEELHLGRRQLLAQTLSAEETVNLRRDCVGRLVRGNVAQELEVIVRHPAWGGLVTVEVEGDFDPRSWVGAIPMYAMQVGLAYIDASKPDMMAASRGSAFGDITNAVVPRTAATVGTTPLTSTFSPEPRFHASSSSHLPQPISATSDLGTANSASHDTSASVKFFHVFLELQAFVASPCSPGETAELYFSLYHKPDARFLTEEFCVILNHNGALARSQPTGSSQDGSSAKGLGKIRTLFVDLGAHDVQESIYLVCRIVRNGSMKMSGVSSSSGLTGSNSVRRGSEAVLGTLSEHEGPNGQGQGVGGSTPFAAILEHPTQTYRRPFGCAVLELTQLAKWSVDRTEATMAKEHTLPIFVPSREATFSTLHQAIIASDTTEFEKSPRYVHQSHNGTSVPIFSPNKLFDRAEMLAVNIKLFHGDAPTIIRENPSLLQDTPVTSRLGFPDVVFPGDARNEVYIKLWSGEFFSSTNTGNTTPRGLIGRVPSFAGALSASRNVQVTVEVRHRNGQVLENVISSGSGEPPMTVFHSMVFYRNNNPTFGELIKLLIPVELMQSCHLFITFRHRDSKNARGGPGAQGAQTIPRSPTDPIERPFAYAFLPLFPENRAFLQDGPHTLLLYKADKMQSITPDMYYGAPATLGPNMRPESVLIPSHLAKSAIPSSDTLTIRSFLCSTKVTQNPELLGLLNWEQLGDKNELCTILSKFTFVGEVEIVKFLRDIFDSLFAVLISKVNDQGDMDDLIFGALVTVLGIVQDRRFTNFQPVLDVYIDKHFTCAPAASKIIKSMNRLLADPAATESASRLRNALKVWHYVFRFVIRARELQRIKEANVGSGATSEHFEQMFKKELMTHLGEVNKLMSTTRPESIIGTQTLAIQRFASILPDLAKVFSTLELVTVVTHFSNAVPNPKGKLIIWKLIMYLQIVKGFLFESAQSRALLVESIVSWIKPYFGMYDEHSHVSPNDLETAKDSSRITWLESTRLCITIVAVMLAQLQQSLISPTTLADRKLQRQENDNVEYVLSLMPR